MCVCVCLLVGDKLEAGARVCLLVCIVKGAIGRCVGVFAFWKAKDAGGVCACLLCGSPGEEGGVAAPSDRKALYRVLHISLEC